MRPYERWSSAAALMAALIASGLLAVSCEELPHKGTAVTRDQCASCHLSDYQRAEKPVHIDTFALSCGDCHDEHAWSPASRFDHDTRFQLRGAHADVACSACHTQGFGPGDTPDQCVDCHRRNFEAARNPSHAEFSTACATCHDTSAWRPAAFNHVWPLTGAHAKALCASCHPGDPPVYAGTRTSCVDCHRADYDASPYPGHGTFPTTCQQCHTTSGWKPATGGAHPESRFPIATGPHGPFECSSCHKESLGPLGKDNTDCVGCHTGVHTRTRMDEKHKEVAGYPRGSASPNFCLSCHANGRN